MNMKKKVRQRRFRGHDPSAETALIGRQEENRCFNNTLTENW